MASPPINVQAIFSNSTPDDKEFSYNAVFNAPVLDRQNDYSVAITRLRVPGIKIQSFVMKDQSKYYFTLSSSNTNVMGTFGIKTFKEYLPDSSGISSTDPDEYVGTVQYYSAGQMLDIFSRCMFRNWIGYLNLWTNYVKTTGWLTESWRTTRKYNWTRTFVPGFITNSAVANIEFHLQRFIASDNPILNDNVISPGDYPTTLSLIDPLGNEIILYNMGIKSYMDLNNYDTNRYLRFTEGAYQAIDFVSLAGSNKNVITYLPLAESLLKLNGNTYQAQTPNWTLKFDSPNFSQYGEIVFRFVWHMVPAGINLPTQPPTFSLDGTRITLNTTTDWLKSDIDIGFSPTIKSMIDFGPSYHIKQNNGDYNFRFPAYIYSNSSLSKALTIYQFAGHISSLSNISRLIISSPSLATQNDYILSTFAIASSNQLADFTIDMSDDGISDLIYSTDAGIIPWRRYLLQSQDPLSYLDLTCQLEYTNGLAFPLVLPPNSTFICRLSFFRNV